MWHSVLHSKRTVNADGGSGSESGWKSVHNAARICIAAILLYLVMVIVLFTEDPRRVEISTDSVR